MRVSPRSLFRRVPIPLAVVFAAGVAVRACFIASYRPGFFGYYDAIGYVGAANVELFGSPYRPAGEPAFVWVLRRLSPDLSVTVAAHHLVGLATALVLYASARKAGARAWLAAFPAGVVLLGGTQIFLEHSTMSEPLFTLLVASGTYGALRASHGGHPLWSAAAGTSVGLATVLRPVGLVLAVIFAGWLLAGRVEVRRRLVAAAITVAATVVIVAGYAGLQASVTGQWGLTRSTGMTLYARIAGFADCSRFKPTPETRRLCERTDPSDRPPPAVYMNDPHTSPALYAFGAPPALELRGAAGEDDYAWGHDAQLGGFARRVIVHQPLDYLASIAMAMANSLSPGPVGPPRVRDWDTSELIQQMQSHEDEAVAAGYFPRFYDTPAAYLRNNTTALDAYARIMRVEGPVSACLLVVALLGLIIGRGTARRNAVLFLLVAVSLQLAAAAALNYDVRYATPTYGFLAGAAALACEAYLKRRDHLSSRSSQAFA